MPRVPSTRSPAQARQTASLHDFRALQRNEATVVEDGQAQVLQLRDTIENLRRGLRNERKRSKRAKEGHLKDIKGREDKENLRRTALKWDKDMAKLRERLAKVEKRLEVRNKKVRSLRSKVFCFPEQKKRAIQKALHRAKLRTQGSWLRIKTKSGRISTQARRIIREIVLRHKVSTSQAGAVLCAVTNAGPGEVISARSSRRIVNEVGVGNKLRVVGEIHKALGKCAVRTRGK